MDITGRARGTSRPFEILKRSAVFKIRNLCLSIRSWQMEPSVEIGEGDLGSSTDPFNSFCKGKLHAMNGKKGACSKLKNTNVHIPGQQEGHTVCFEDGEAFLDSRIGVGIKSIFCPGQRKVVLAVWANPVCHRFVYLKYRN